MKKCMIGERYGSLVVIEKVKIPGKLKTYWRCRCDCGNTCTVEDSHLKNGHTRSCGCRRRIRLQEKRLDLTGQRYGRLVVLGTAAGTAEKCDGAVEQSGSSGHRGVYRRENNRWRASIGFQGKSYNLGSFATYEEAVQARLDAEKRLYDPFLAKYREKNS